MPLRRLALLLGPGPRGVRDARRWVGEVCAEIGRPELAECARLGVSELVTNALMHASGPIELRVCGTREHPRVEVRDSSTEPPVLPTPTELDPGGLGEHLDDVLLTVGRGLSMVARSASAWGADLEPDGKVVWFVPASTIAEDDGVRGVITGGVDRSGPARAPLSDPVTVQVLGVPLRAYASFDRHLRELRREVRLLALAHETAYPLAKDLSDLFGSLEKHLHEVIGTVQLERARAEGRGELDLEVVMSRSVTRTMTRFSELLDLADEFCRAERLLSLARTPEQRRFQRWLLGELVRQGDGEHPIPWTDVPHGLTAQPGRRSVGS